MSSVKHRIGLGTVGSSLSGKGGSNDITAGAKLKAASILTADSTLITADTKLRTADAGYPFTADSTRYTADGTNF